MSVAPKFDEVIHARNRLHICALLAEVDCVDFATVQQTLDVSDYVISKHLKAHLAELRRITRLGA